MRSGLESGTLGQLDQQQVNLVFFVEIGFKSGDINLWSGVGDISFDSKTWTGAGQLLMIQPARETTGVVATGLTITLTGIDPTFLALALVEAQQNRPVTCLFGFLDSSGAIITDPYQFFSGLVNFMTIDEGGRTATISVNAENDLIQLQRPRIRRYTDQDLQGEFDGDLGLIHIAALQEWNGFWGGGEAAGDGRSDGGTQRDADVAEQERRDIEASRESEAGPGFIPPEFQTPDDPDTGQV